MSAHPQRIPDLWRLNEDARRLYQLYLAHLQMNDLHEDVVSACRVIRRYATRGPGINDGLFTFSFEIDALYELKDYETALRQLRLRDQIVFGERFDYARREWSANDSMQLEFQYAPAHYFLGKYKLGCKLLETALSFWFQFDKFNSYDILFRVYNGDDEPWGRCRVTLANFYDRLGQPLSDWNHWNEFIDGFHPKLFRLGGVRRDRLLADSDQLPVFFDNLLEVRDRHNTTGVGYGQSDLIDSAAKVSKRQQTTQENLDAHTERNRSARELQETKLRNLFPELKRLLK